MLSLFKRQNKSLMTSDDPAQDSPALARVSSCKKWCSSSASREAKRLLAFVLQQVWPGFASAAARCIHFWAAPRPKMTRTAGKVGAL